LKKNNCHTLIKIFSFVLFNFIVFGSSEIQSSENKKDTYPFLELFAETMHYVEKNYVDSVNRNELIEGAIIRMLESLDSESYLKVYDKNFKDTNFDDFFFKKFGVTFYPKDGYVALINVLENSPLSNAGLQSGDLIRGVNEILCLSMGTYKFYNLLFENISKNPEVNINYIRNNDTFDVKVNFSESKKDFQNVSVTKINDEFLHIKIFSFLNGTKEKILDAYEDLNNKKIKGIVVDIRNCARGILSETLEVADMFLESQKIVTLKFKSGKDVDYFAVSHKEDINKPAVILINQNSIGYAELLAASLKQRENTKIFGEKTIGKGKYQMDVKLDDKYTIHISGAEFIEPSGNSIEKNGVNPDVIYDYEKIRDLEEIEDPFLNECIDLLKSMI